MGRPHIIGRIIVFSVNFSLWLAGILLIVFGSIGVADEDTTVNLLNLIDGVSYVTDIISVAPYVEGASIFMIVLGVFLFLLGGNGCHGIMRKNKRSICVYWILLLGAILIEIALIIYASVYPATTNDSVKEDMQLSLNTSFNGSVVVVQGNTLQFALDNSVANSWQHLEFETACCGANGPNDYSLWRPIPIGYPTSSQTGDFPLSCCTLKKKGKPPTVVGDISDVNKCLSKSAGFYNTEGCWKTVNDMIWQFNLIAIILSSCLIAAELVGVIFASRLWLASDD